MTTSTSSLPAPPGAGQLGLDGMPARLYSCTPARLTTWDDCPRRYRMAYLERPPPAKGPPWAHNSVGASVHNALAGWWRLPRERRTPEAAGALLDAGWIADGFRDTAQSEACRLRARRLVVDYVSGLDPDDEPVGVERTVAVRTSRLALSGRVDRLDRRPTADGGTDLVVVDYKTGRHRPSDDDARTSLPLAVYAAASGRTMRSPCVRVELHHLPSGTIAAHEHTESSLDRQLRRAESIAADAQQADDAWRAGRIHGDELDSTFPPRPGPRCQWCDYVRHCPAGRAVGVPRRPWEGVEAPDRLPVDSG
jgi:RecB family exonuclease